MSNYWSNKLIYNINSKKRYASGYPLNEKGEPIIKSLNGEWFFKFYKSVKDLPENFYKDFCFDNLDTIKVPSNWQIEGYDIPMYCNIAYPYAIESKLLFAVPKIKASKNPAGVYKKEFFVSEHQGNVFINFAGINSCGEIYINGEFVGYSEDTFDFQEYDITSFVKVGKNIVTVAVYRFCTGSYLEDQDMWRLSGIFRDVTIIYKPNSEISDFFARSEFFNGDYSKALFKADVATASAKGCLLQVQLKSVDGTVVLDYQTSVDSDLIKIEQHLGDIKLWSHEFPNLYRLEIVLSKDNEFVDRRECDFGFREIKTAPFVNEKGPYILLNGKPLKFRGVNRHEFHPEYGHAVPAELIKKDLQLCLENNVTAIRTSHYPNSKVFYELCDRMGILVMCENNLETHGLSFMMPKNSPMWTEQCVYRMENMVNTYKNHACIVFWSLGNESGFGDAFQKMKDATLAIDNTRPIHYEEDISAKVSDVISEMYAPLDKMEKIGKNEKIRHCQTTVFCPLGVTYTPEMYRDLPYIQCEYAHCMGNSLGNFADYWEQFKKYDRLAGGFIWDFADQSIKVVIDGVTQWRYGGDFGERPNAGSFAFNGIVRGDRSPNPALFEVKKVYQMVDFLLEDNNLTIKNNHMFNDIEGYLLEISYLEDGKEFGSEKFVLEAIAPSASKVITLNIPNCEGELTCVCQLKTGKNFAVIKKGHIIAVEQFVLKEKLLTAPKIEGGGSFIQNDWEITVTVDDMQVVFDKATGALSSISRKERERLKSPLIPNFYRAAIDNDRFAQVNLSIVKKIMGVYRYRDAMKKMRPKNINVYDTDGVISIVTDWSIPGIKKLCTEYKIGKGEIDFYMTVLPKKPLIRYGFIFGTRESIKDMSFYAKGPHENHCDRNTSAVLKYYEGVAEDFNHEYLFPQENGNHTEARYLDLGNDSSGLLILAEEKPFEFGVLPYTTEKLDNAKHLHELVKDKHYTVTIDGKQRGVGGDIPALACLKKQYKILPKRAHTLNFRMIVK